jgi:ferrous iron transport protein B
LYCFNRQPKYRKNFGFNQLTGLNQQVGNYPGITVEKIGFCKLPNVLRTYWICPVGLNASSIVNVVIELMNKKGQNYILM